MGQRLLPEQNNVTFTHYSQSVCFGLVIFDDFLYIQTGTNFILPVPFSHLFVHSPSKSPVISPRL